MTKLDDYYIKGNYEKIIEVTGKVNLNEISEELIMRVKSLRELSKYDEATALILPLIESIDQNGQVDSKEIALFTEYLYILYRTEKYSEFIELVHENQKFIEQLQENQFDIYYKALWYYLRGNVNWKQNKIDQARENYTKSLKIASKLSNDEFLIRLENSLANLLLKENKYNDAIEHYEKSLQLAVKNNNLKFQIYAHINISIVYRSQGLIKKALDQMNTLFALEDKIQNLETKGVLENNLGIIYYHLGQYNAAIIHFEKGFEALKEIQSYSHISEGMFYYLLTLRETKNFQQFEEILEFFKELEQRAESTTASYRYNLASAMYYYDQNSIISKAEAMKILNQLQNSNVTDEFFSLLTSIHACNLFIEELILYFDIQILEKVKSIITYLQDIAENQHSYILEVEIGRLTAKIEILEGDRETAKELLDKAIKIADKYQLIHLKNKIINDQKELKLDESLVGEFENETVQLNPIMFKEQLYTYQIFLHPIRLCVFKELVANWSISSSKLRKLIKTSWGKLLTHINKMEEDGMIEYKNGFEDGSVVKVIELTPLGEDKYREFKKFMEYNL